MGGVGSGRTTTIECYKGHVRTEKNTHIAKNGRRRCKDCSRKSYREFAQRLRQKILDKFGRECVRCGYNANEKALQLDHVHGGGNKELRTIGSHGVSVKAIKEPEKYQMLCANCNIIKRFEEDMYVI